MQFSHGTQVSTTDFYGTRVLFTGTIVGDKPVAMTDHGSPKWKVQATDGSLHILPNFQLTVIN